jgi:hypothetical protein
MSADPVTVEEIKEALRQLGGKAAIEQVHTQVTRNRGGVPPGFVTPSAWWNSVQRVIEDHLDGYLKPEYVKGPIAFYLISWGVEEGEAGFNGKATIALSIPKEGRRL